jgi:3-hydroxybutyryl-CoA dehydrogenase
VIEKVVVVGAGQMGAGIAQVAAAAGMRVTLVDVGEEQLGRALAGIGASLAKLASKGQCDDPDGVLARISTSTELDSAADAELAIEAASEDVELKLALFRRLDAALNPGAILASNTSSIPIMKLAVATERPTHVIGVHFFNPVPVLSLVELVPSLLTDDSTTDRARAFVEGQLGKHAIHCQDRAGFVVNALLVPFVLSAIRMLESGFATASDIDEGLVRGAAHPQGPLALADLIGLDTVQAVAESLYEEFKEPLYAPPPLLSRMVDAGLLGRKTGRGFYDYAR